MPYHDDSPATEATRMSFGSQQISADERLTLEALRVQVPL
jgi:hypothetical protein